MLASILGFLGGVNPSKIVSDITGFLSARVQAASNTEIAKIKSGEAVELKREETDALIAQLQQAIVLADQRWWATRWIRPGFAYLTMFHYAAIIASSCGYIGTINALPYPFDYLEAGIIGAYFVLRPFEKVRRTSEVK